MDITFQYPPDLFNLLVDTIPRLCRSKKDVVLFFRGAGVPRTDYGGVEKRLKADSTSISKYDIAREVLTKLNSRGEPALRERREVLKRVTKFEEFESCWENDRLKAKGLVADVRNLVNVKDSFTRIELEREQERRARQLENEQRRKAEEERRVGLHRIREDFLKLFSEPDHWKRGRLLEGVLNLLFAAHGISVREAFTIRGKDNGGVVEQIDGVIELDGHIYLVEVKWWGQPLSPEEISRHLVRVYHRGHSRGVFVSGAGYTSAAIGVCTEALQKTVFILCELSEFVRLVEQEMSLRQFLKEKVSVAIAEKKPLHFPLS